MLKPKKVQAPEGCMPHLTAGKIYSVVGFWDNDISDNFGYGFTIISDLGNEISCNERNCAHLNGNNWIIIETENN